MLSAPSTKDFHHHEPVGSRRAMSRAISPAGSARMREVNMTESAGTNSCAT